MLQFGSLFCIDDLMYVAPQIHYQVMKSPTKDDNNKHIPPHKNGPSPHLNMLPVDSWILLSVECF